MALLMLICSHRTHHFVCKQYRPRNRDWKNGGTLYENLVPTIVRLPPGGFGLVHSYLERSDQFECLRVNNRRRGSFRFRRGADARTPAPAPASVGFRNCKQGDCQSATALKKLWLLFRTCRWGDDTAYAW